MKQAEAIAKEKMKDLNAFDIKEATKIICGSARSMILRLRNRYEENSKRYNEILKMLLKIKELVLEALELVKKILRQSSMNQLMCL